MRLTRLELHGFKSFADQTQLVFEPGVTAIVGPNVNGWIVQLTGNNWNNIMLVAPIFLGVAVVLMLGVKRGEAVVEERPVGAPVPEAGD